jgi:hypothetical protein
MVTACCRGASWLLSNRPQNTSSVGIFLQLNILGVNVQLDGVEQPDLEAVAQHLQRALAAGE